MSLVQPHQPTAPSEVDSDLYELLDAERRRSVLENAPRTMALFLAAGFIIGVLEWIFRPAHRSAALLIGAAYFLISVGLLAYLRWRPERALGASVVAVNALMAALIGYSPLVYGNSELSALAATVALAGFAVLLPMGGWYQALGSLTTVVLYPLSLQYSVSAISYWHSSVGLAIGIVVLVIGAQMIDQYRLRILRLAAQQAALARENERLLQRARSADESKSVFLATVSHELRSPLGIIVGYLDFLGDDNPPDERKEAIQRIDVQATTMLNLIQGLLEVHKIEAAHPELSISEFDVADLLSSLRDNLPPQWQRPAVDLRFEIPAGVPHLQTDRIRLETILRNLIHNALKYTARGSVTVTATPMNGQQVAFRVRDTGEGIVADQLPKIFEMFSQASAPREGGVGLGLHIVQRFSRALGGGVTVESQLGVGTTFEVRLPRSIAPTD